MPSDYILPAAFTKLDNSGRRGLELHFAGLSVTTDFVPPPVNYAFMCFTNRCGSDFLSQAIASAGVVPEFEEPFNTGHIIQQSRAHGIGSLQDYFEFCARELGGNNWFASKLGVEQLALFVQSGLLARIVTPRHFLFIERTDKISQAISRSLAWQTQRWTSQQISAVPEAAITYDRDAITRAVRRISWENALFQTFFAANGLVPIHLSYEELAGDPVGTVRGIGEKLGAGSLIADLSRVVVGKLPGGLNADWKRRYLAGL